MKTTSMTGPLALLLALAPLGCGKPDPALRPLRPEEVIDFTALYQKNCAGCHGASGRLGPAPPLNDPLFRALASPEDLLQAISQGRPGTPMPAFAKARGGTLTEAQVQILAKHIQGGTEPWGAVPARPAGAPPYLTPTEERGDVARGRLVFARACAGCHGDQGQGAKEGAVNDSAFLALISDQALRRIIITGRPDLGMPSYAGADGRDKNFQPLTSPEVSDLVALLADWRKTPASQRR